jgi:hypothetical protein
VIRHTCGSVIPADVGTYVRHLASCPETKDEIKAWCGAVVSAVEYEVALDETPPETATETRDLTPAEMAAMRDAGESLRDIANLAGVAPETVRRRIKKHERGES